MALALTLTLTAAAGPSASAPATGTTVLAALARANVAAKEWNADAVLTNASTLRANPDGTAASWSFLFYSPRTKKGFSVDVRAGKAETLEVNPHLKDPVGEFVDSDRALQEAKKNGLAGPGPLTMAVMPMGQSTKEPGAYWTVGAGFSKGSVSVVLEAKTGKFFTRHAVD
jgi:hypothetical protein